MSEELGLLCKNLVKRSSVGLEPFELRCRCACFQTRLRRDVSAMCCDVRPCEGWATWGAPGIRPGFMRVMVTGRAGCGLIIRPCGQALVQSSRSSSSASHCAAVSISCD